MDRINICEDQCRYSPKIDQMLERISIGPGLNNRNISARSTVHRVWVWTVPFSAGIFPGNHLEGAGKLKASVSADSQQISDKSCMEWTGIGTSSQDTPTFINNMDVSSTADTVTNIGSPGMQAYTSANTEPGAT